MLFRSATASQYRSMASTQSRGGVEEGVPRGKGSPRLEDLAALVLGRCRPDGGAKQVVDGENVEARGVPRPAPALIFRAEEEGGAGNPFPTSDFLGVGHRDGPCPSKTRPWRAPLSVFRKFRGRGKKAEEEGEKEGSGGGREGRRREARVPGPGGGGFKGERRGDQVEEGTMVVAESVVTQNA